MKFFHYFHYFLDKNRVKFHALSQKIDRCNSFIMEKSCWCLLATTSIVFIVSVLRYSFNLGWIWMQDSAIYFNTLLLVLSPAYTLLKDEHVRVDIFHKKMQKETRVRVELYASFLLFIPFISMIFITSLPYVYQSWIIWENSVNIGGLPGVFLIKTFLLVMTLLLFIQGLSQIWKSYSFLYLESPKYNKTSQKLKNSQKSSQKNIKTYKDS